MSVLITLFGPGLIAMSIGLLCMALRPSRTSMVAGATLIVLGFGSTFATWEWLGAGCLDYLTTCDMWWADRPFEWLWMACLLGSLVTVVASVSKALWSKVTP